MRQFLGGLFALLLFAGAAQAQNAQQYSTPDRSKEIAVTTVTPLPTFGSLKTYQLLNGSAATGASTPVTILDGGRGMVFTCTATTFPTTVVLQSLGPDGTTYQNGPSLSAAGSALANVPPGAVVRVNVTGTPAGLSCNLG